MRYAVLFSALVVTLGTAQTPMPRSAFEKVIANPGVRFHSSERVGTLESGTSRAVFTALVVSEPAQPDRMVRGVRIEFSEPGYRRFAYIDDSLLGPLKEAVDRLSADARRFTPDRTSGSGPGYWGVREFRDHPELYPVTVDYCYSGACAPSLRFTSPTVVQFTNCKPVELSAILAEAIQYLR